MNVKLIAAALTVLVAVGRAQSAALPANLLPVVDDVSATPLGAVQWIERIVQQLQQHIADNLDSWTDRLHDVADRFAADLDELTAAVEQTRDQSAAGVCVREHIARLAAIRQTAGASAGACIQTGIAQVQDLQAALQQHAAAIRAEGAKIVQVVNECRAQRPDDLRQCVVDNLQEIVNAVRAIVVETLELVVQAVVQAQVIVEQTKGCVNAVLLGVEQQQADSQQELRDCLAEAIKP